MFVEQTKEIMEYGLIWTCGQQVLFHNIFRGGPFDTWGGGLWFFLRDQTFFFVSQLKRTIFFRPYQKQTIFFSTVKLKTIFSPFILVDSLYTMLSSGGITTFTWIFHHVFDKESYCVELVVQNC